MITTVRIGAKVAAAVLCASAALGCSSEMEVTRVVSPSQVASFGDGKLTPTAVVRENERIAIPKNAQVQPERIVIARGEYSHKLGPRDILEQDSEGRIIAVRTPGDPPVVIRFVPGSVRTPEGTDEIRGLLEGGETTIALKPTDRIEVHGTFKAGESVPGGGRVETKRFDALIFSGLLVAGLSYIPTAYAGLQSDRSGDKTLLLPVLGPWINLLGRSKCRTPDDWNQWADAANIQIPIDPCIDEKVALIAIIAAGSAQTLGAVMTVLGFGLTKTEIVYDGNGQATARTKGPNFMMVPTSNGVSAIGTF